MESFPIIVASVDKLFCWISGTRLFPATMQGILVWFDA